MPTLSQQEAAILEAARAYAKAYRRVNEDVHTQFEYLKRQQEYELAELDLRQLCRTYGR